MRAKGHRATFLWLMGSLILAAWAVLFIWEHSAYGRYLDHGDWTNAGLAAAICQSLPAGQWLLPAILYVGGWVLMCAAMMLPTTLPLLQIHRRLVRAKPDRNLLSGLVVGGYLATWTAFGLLAHGLDWVVHEAAQASAFLTFNGWAIGAAVIALAGLYQLSPIKDFCLERCRLPVGFVVRRVGTPRPRLSAFSLGLEHGVYCVGCCWALMLLMFVVGTGSVAWMLALGAVMAVEKNLPWGARLSTPLGGLLIVAAAAIVMAERFPALI